MMFLERKRVPLSFRRQRAANPRVVEALTSSAHGKKLHLSRVKRG